MTLLLAARRGSTRASAIDRRVLFFLGSALLAFALGAAHAQTSGEAGAPAPEPGATPGVEPQAAPPPAEEKPAAKPASDVTLQEIVITSTRRAEVMSKVPISVSAFSQETLENLGAKDISDVVRFTPGIKIDQDGTNNIAIRGIASSAGASTTGIYIDDTPIQMRQLGFNADEALPKAFDLERMEVLRGPQGTLFGAGAEGGAVRYIMAQPNMSKTDVITRSEVSFTQGGAPSYETGIAAGAPIVDNVLGFRGSIWFRHDGGWIDRVNPYDTNEDVAPHTNYVNSLAGRLAAKWAVNEDVAITPSMLYQDRVSNDVSTYWPVLSNPADNSYVSGWPLGRREPDRYFLPAVKAEADLGGVATLISNTSYFTRYDLSGYDGTTYNLGYYETLASPNNTTLNAPGTSGIYLVTPYFPFITGAGLNPNFPPALQAYRANGAVTNNQQTFAQELRLQSDDTKAALLWTAGLFFSKTHQGSTEEIYDPDLATFFQTAFNTSYLNVFGVPLLPNGDSYYNHNDTHDAQIAIFGEATYALTDKLKATAGLRYSRVSVSYYNFANGPQNFGPSGGPGQEVDKPLAPKLSLSYQADQGNLFYATYAKGYRPGGANAPIPFAPCSYDFANLGLANGAPTSYKYDTTQSYEVGAKNRVGDNFRIASSLYYINWQGIQQNIYLPTCGFQFTANSGDAVSKGGDIQIEYAATSSLDFDLAIGNTNARFTENAGFGGTPLAVKGDAIEGIAPGATPPWTVAFGTQYNFNAFDHKSFLRLDYEYTGHSGALGVAEDPRTAQYNPYDYTTRANEFVSLRAGTSLAHWNVSAFIDNLFDSHPSMLDSSDPNSSLFKFQPPTYLPLSQQVAPSSLISAYTYRPRTFGITASYHLN